MKHYQLLAIVFFGGIASASAHASLEGCPIEFPKTNLCASLTWITAATEDDIGEFALRFWDKTQGTESGPYAAPAADVGVKLWMPSMNHGSSPVKVAPALDDMEQPIYGVYSATGVYFVMHGEWEIRLELTKDGKPVDQATVPFTF